MSVIQVNSSIVHLNSTLNVNNNKQYTSVEEGFVSASIGVASTDEVVDVGEIINPKFVFVKNISGDDLRIGMDGSTYPFRLTTGEAMTVRLDAEGLVETQTVTTVADVASSLDGTYFTLEGNSGTWAVWIDVGDTGTAEPAHGMTNDVEVTAIVADATAAQVAAAIYAALAASTAFLADFTVTYVAASSLITITDKYTGTRTNLANGGTSPGFTMSTTQAGAASPQVHLKSVGTTQAVVAVAPV